MNVITSIREWQKFRSSLQVSSLGFVPTMGALHKGHISLVQASRKNNSYTVVSVFINPKQFEDAGDLNAYPVDHETDLARLKEVGVDVVFLPDAKRIYPDDYRFRVTETSYSQKLCGAHRPGHFDGVLTVVMRLLNLVKPDNAYFGEKDYQQLQLIRDMTAAFFMPVDIVACPTVREADGLAMSSRNKRLNKEQRGIAASLHTAIKQSRSALQARELLAQQGFRVDYVEDILGRRLAAASLGDIRLIDNVQI